MKLSNNGVFAVFVPALLMIFSQAAIAQRGWNDEGQDRPMRDRLQRFWKMRVVEMLKLSEDDAVRFAAKQTAHEDKTREIMKARNSALDSIDELLKNNGDEKQLQAAVDAVLDADRKMGEERRRYHEELRQFLPPQKFAQFLVFERSFNRQVRNALEEVNGNRPPH